MSSLLIVCSMWGDGSRFGHPHESRVLQWCDAARDVGLAPTIVALSLAACDEQVGGVRVVTEIHPRVLSTHTTGGVLAPKADQGIRRASLAHAIRRAVQTETPEATIAISGGVACDLRYIDHLGRRADDILDASSKSARSTGDTSPIGPHVPSDAIALNMHEAARVDRSSRSPRRIWVVPPPIRESATRQPSERSHVVVWGRSGKSAFAEMLFISQHVAPKLREAGCNVPVIFTGSASAGLSPRGGLLTTGTVPKIHDVLRHGIAVIRAGCNASGMSFRVADAIGARVPIVANRAALRGWSLTAGDSVLIAEEAEDVAHSIVRLLRSPRLVQRLVNNAYAESTQCTSDMNTASEVVEHLCFR